MNMMMSITPGQNDRLIDGPLPTDADYPFAIKLRDLCQIHVVERLRWDTLADVAGFDSPFARHHMVLPMAENDPYGRRVMIAILYNARGEWRGVMPLVFNKRLGRMPLMHVQGYCNPNRFSGVPLVYPGYEQVFWTTLRRALVKHNGAGCALRLGKMPDDHRATMGLRADMAAAGLPIRILSQVSRGAFVGGAGEDWAAHLSPKRRARLRAQRRQIEDVLGPLRLARADKAGAQRWADAFMAMEAAGWKGQAGSALANLSATNTMFRSLVKDGLDEGWLEGLTLYAGDAPLAMSAHFMNATHGAGFKMAFDEQYRRYGVGLLLIKMLSHDMAEQPGLQFDSGSSPDNAIINELWPTRRVVSDMIVPLAPGLAAQQLAARWALRRAYFGVKTALLSRPDATA